MERDPEATYDFLTDTYRNAKLLVIGIVSVIGILISAIALNVQVSDAWTSVRFPLYAIVAGALLLLVLLGGPLIVMAMLYRRSLQSISFFRSKALNFEAAFQDLEELAYTDAITGIPNSNALEKELERTAASTRRCLIMLDLIDFGSINKKYNHWSGDKYLRAFSGMVVASSRRNEFIYKSRPKNVFSPDSSLGGMGGNDPMAFRKNQGSDEFFVLLEGPLVDGLGFLNRLKGRQREFEAMAQKELGGDHPFGFHAGITTVAMNEPYESVVDRVSQCLCKAQDPDCQLYVWWSPELTETEKDIKAYNILAATRKIFAKEE